MGHAHEIETFAVPATLWPTQWVCLGLLAPSVDPVHRLASPGCPRRKLAGTCPESRTQSGTQRRRNQAQEVLRMGALAGSGPRRTLSSPSHPDRAAGPV